MWLRLSQLHVLSENLFWPHLLSALILWFTTGYAVGGWTWFVTFFRFFTLQTSNGYIYFVTYTMAWLTFVSILYLRRFLGRRALLIASAAPFGGAGLYELIQNLVGLAVYPSAFSSWIVGLGLLNLLAWVFLGLLGVYYWNLGRAWWILISVYSVSWIVWGLDGFPQITWGSFSQYPVAYLANVFLKIASFVIFALPLWINVEARSS